MQKNYLLTETKPKQTLNIMLQKLNFNPSSFLNRKGMQSLFAFLLLMVTSLGYCQFPENFESGIPATWTVTSNLATPPINNNWVATALGYSPTAPTPPTTNGVLVNPALNTTTGSTADYWLISPQVTTIANGEFRFFAKQGSISNKGTIYKVLATTGNPADLTPGNWTLLKSWTEITLNNGSSTTWTENVASTATIPAGISVHIALVAEVPTGKTGDITYIDAFRYIPQCVPITGITTVLGSESTVINWTGTAPNYSISVVPSTSGPGTYTTVAGTSYTATGLTANTSYNVYVISDCDATTTSAVAGPFTFTTLVEGFTCATAINVPSDVTVTPYIYSNNLANFYDANTYVTYDSTLLSCQPIGSTYNLLSGDHAYFSYTPSITGLVNINQAVNVASGGGGNNCYNNLSSLFVFNGCAGVGTSAACLGGIQTTSNTLTAQLSNFYVQAGQTYIILISSPFQHVSPGAGMCFTLTISGSTCPPPAVITYSNLEQTSLTASWDNTQNLVSAWEYLALPGSSGTPSASQSGTPTTTNFNNSITGLTAGTAYSLFVRAVCGGVPGPWSAPLLFNTQCFEPSLPYYTGFDGDTATSPESCWTVLNLNNDYNQFSFGFDAGIAAPNNDVAKLRTSTGVNDMLVTPQFHFDGVTQKRLRFKYNVYGNWGLVVNNPTGGPGSFEIDLSTNGIGPLPNNFTTNLVPLASYTTAYNYIEMIVPIPITVVGDVNIAWYLPPGSVQTGNWLYIDDVYVEDMPTCSDPIYPSIVAGSITSTSAQLAWTNGYNTSQWQIIAQPQGTGMPAANATGGMMTTNNPYIYTNLTPSTQYEFWVRSYCDATHQSNWVGPVNFYTTCIAQPTPYYESFNDGDITSKKFCWTIQDRNNDPAKWVLNATEAEISPEGIDYFTPLANFDDWLVSVPINIVGQKRLRYKCKVSSGLLVGPAQRGDMEVLISNDPSFATYTTLVPEHEFTNNAYVEQSVIFTGTGVSYIAFRIPPTMVDPANSGNVFIDDVYVEDAPACQVPSNLAVSGITTTSANLSWSLGFTETQWEVVIQAANSGIPTGSGIIVSPTSTYPATGLTPDTAYEYYVRADCDATHVSSWVGPFAFRTTCNPFPTPFTETFDSTSSSKYCWTIVNANTDINFWNLNESADYPIGDEMAALNTATNGNNNDWLITPTLTVHPNQRLRFKYKTLSPYYEEDLKVMLSTSGVAPAQFTTTLYQNNLIASTDATGTVTGSNIITIPSIQDVRVGDVIYIPGWPFAYQTTVTAINGNAVSLSTNATLTQTGVQNVTFTHETINNPDFIEKVIDLPSGLTGNINIGFYVPFFPPNPWGYRGQFLFIDNVIVEDIPSCPSVSNVTASNVIDTSADINWTVNGTETSWNISVQPYGTPAPVGATLPAYLTTTTTHPKTITGLTPSTHYQYYVQSVCSGSSSEWVGPFDLITKCDYSNVCQYTMSVSNGNTGEVYQGIEVMQNGNVVQLLTFPVVAPNQPTVIDYPVFLCRGVEYSLYFLVGDGANGTQYSQAQVVIKDQNNAVVWTSPLGLGTGNATIYTGVSNCGVVTCPQPTNLVASSENVLSWTPGATETQWEVFVQPYNSGTLPQSGHIVTSPSYTPGASDFTNGAAGTYEYLVRAVCSGSDKSFWSGPFVFVRNDEANTSVTLPVNTGATCDNSGVDASFIGATVSANPTTCTTQNIGDIWYDFVATSKVHIIELSDFAPGLFWTNIDSPTWPKINMTLYEVQPDGSLLQKGCTEDNSLVTIYSSELVVGHTYKIRVVLNTTLQPNNKTFHICITTPSDPCTMNAFNYDFEKLPMQTVTGVETIIDSREIPG